MAERIRLETGRAAVSAATIYRAIAARGPDASELSRTARGIASGPRHRGKRRRRRGKEERRGNIPVDHELFERPAEASSRSRLGDWEADTVVGRGSGPCLVSMVDRASGLPGEAVRPRAAPRRSRTSRSPPSRARRAAP